MGSLPLVPNPKVSDDPGTSMPSRRTPLTLFAFVALALTIHAARVMAQRILGMATLAPPGSTWMRTFDAANRELRRRTGGALALRWYAGGVQGDEAEVVRKIRVGRLDGAALMATGLGQIHRPVMAFQLPAMFQSAPQFIRAYAALAPEIERSFDRAGFSLITFGPATGARMFSQREIRTPEDLRASRPWRWPDDPILPALYQEVGAVGVPLQIPEVVGALQTHRVDTVFASPLAAIALQWSAHVQFMSSQPASGSLGGIVLSHAAYASLPTDHQRVLREVCLQFGQLLLRNVQRDEATALQALAQHGVRTVTVDDATRARWLAVFSRVRARLTGVIADAAWMERVRTAGGAP